MESEEKTEPRLTIHLISRFSSGNVTGERTVSSDTTFLLSSLICADSDTSSKKSDKQRKVWGLAPFSKWMQLPFFSGLINASQEVNRTEDCQIFLFLSSGFLSHYQISHQNFHFITSLLYGTHQSSNEHFASLLVINGRMLFGQSRFYQMHNLPTYRDWDITNNP